MLTIDDILTMTDDQLRARKGELLNCLANATVRLADLSQRLEDTDRLYEAIPQ